MRTSCSSRLFSLAMISLKVVPVNRQTCCLNESSQSSDHERHLFTSCSGKLACSTRQFQLLCSRWTARTWLRSSEIPKLETKLKQTQTDASEARPLSLRIELVQLQLCQVKRHGNQKVQGHFHLLLIPIHAVHVVENSSYRVRDLG